VKSIDDFIYWICAGIWGTRGARGSGERQCFGKLDRLRDGELAKLLGWPGYRVCRHEIDEKRRTLRLWVRRKRGSSCRSNHSAPCHCRFRGGLCETPYRSRMPNSV